MEPLLSTWTEGHVSFADSPMTRALLHHLAAGPGWLALLLAMQTCSARPTELSWDHLPPLPPAAGQSKQPGVASPFVGVHGDALLVAGGANFPEKAPWEGGAKVWWRDLFVLEHVSGARPAWVQDKRFTLPHTLAYGVSVSTPDGIVCVGGADAERCYADVFLLSWDSAAREIRRVPLPALPQPLAFGAAALVGRTLYVAGGQHSMHAPAASSAFWSLDLAQRQSPNFGWNMLPTWPGPARIVPVAAGAHDTFYLFSGRRPRPGQPTEILRDAYAFEPKTKTWRALGNIGGTAEGVSVMAGTAVATDDEVLLFGGDRGDVFLELEAHDRAIEALRAQLAAAEPAKRAALQAEIEGHLETKKKRYVTHAGFSRDVLGYQPRANTWRVVAHAPVALPVTTIAVQSGGTVIIPSGEVRPGIRTAEVVKVKL